MTGQSHGRSLSVSDLNTEISKDEPRIRDVRLGERLNMSRSRDVRKIIERNVPELETHGPLATRRRKSRGQEYAEYWLNEAQALLLCMFARTQRAAEVRKEVIAVYMAVRRGEVSTAAGVSRMLAHKVAGLERGMDLILHSLKDCAHRMDGLIVAHDARMGAVTAIPALQVAMERKAQKRPRGGFVQRVSNALSRHCERDTRWTIHRDGYGRKLFARPAIDDWLERGGWGPLKEYLDLKGGQTVFTLVPKGDE